MGAIEQVLAEFRRLGMNSLTLESGTEIRVGEKYRIDFGPDSCATKTVHHLRAIVDGDQLVIRNWSPRKGWRYLVEDVMYLNVCERGGFPVVRLGKSKEREGYAV